MRPTLSQCFPNPLSHQWPSTSKPVLCESQQLYALVCICCCVPNTHLLVLQEKESGDMVTLMPKGPRYVELRITARTTPEDLSSFLLAAETASIAAGPSISTLHTSSETAPGREDFFYPEFSRCSRTQNYFKDAAPHGGKPRSREQQDISADYAAREEQHQRQIVVVCLNGIMAASAAVLSVLTTFLTFGHVWHNRVTRMVPSIRIVASCDYQLYVSLLPESVRSCFALSTFLSDMTKDNTLILQSSNPKYSSIVNKHYMNQVIFSPVGHSLIDTVTLTGEVSRYLCHLLEVVRGCIAMELAPGPFIMHRIPHFLTLLKAAAMLFMPNEEEQFWRNGGRRTNSSHRILRTDSVISSLRVSLDGNADENDLNSVHTNAWKPITTLEQVVVSPTDVICLIPAFVSHLLTLHRSFVDKSACVAAVRERMAGLSRPLSTDITRYENISSLELETSREGSTLMSSLWDVHIASLALVNDQRTKAGGEPSMKPNSKKIVGSFHVHEDTTKRSLVVPSSPTRKNFPIFRRESPIFDHATAPVIGSMRAKRYDEGELYASNLHPSMVGISESSYSGLTRDDRALTSNYCDYCDVRDLVRAAIVCYSAPSPG